MSKINYDRIMKLAAIGEQMQPLLNYDEVAALVNPMCGDDIKLTLVNDKGIIALGFEIRGCLLCQAAGGRMYEMFHGAACAEVGKRLVEILEMFAKETTPQGMEPFYAMHKHRARQGCVLLPFKALRMIMPDEAMIPSPAAGGGGK